MIEAPNRSAGFANVNGANLHYEIAGSGPSVVLIHAGICDGRMWDDQWAAFTRHYRVLRYDVRGCGKSVMPPAPFAHHRDLLGLLQFAGVERTAIVAASMGGGIAVDLTLEHPEMVDALVLVGSGVGDAEPSHALVHAWDDVDAAISAGDIDRANEIEMQLWVDGPSRPPDRVNPAVRERARVMNANNFALIEEAATPEPLAPPARERLEEIGVPTLIIAGDLDQPHVLASADSFERRIPGARKVIMQGTAHLPSMEQPEAFTGLVLDFLGAVAGNER